MLRKLFFRFAILCFLTTISVTAQTAATSKCACCTENHQAFDFWVGTWKVTNADGSFAGTNVIEKIQDECIIRENRKSAKVNYTGSSYNFYNTQKKQWEQIWVDNQGGNLHLKGNRIGNKMILQSDMMISPKGQKYINRITWTLNQDGSVRQLWETSSDQQTWKVVFDGLYVKEK